MMMRLLINGLSASAGGGLTYLHNVLPHLSARTDVETILAISPQVRAQFRNLARVSFIELNSKGGAAQRFWREQRVLPKLARDRGADVLISAGNFALRSSPISQILLSRNALYTCPDFYRDLLDRGEYAMWLDTRIRGTLAKRSISWADSTVAPSHVFAQQLSQWTGHEVVPIYHGFDRDNFFGDRRPLPAEIIAKLARARDSIRLLLVSHYNYYRNFETLLRAMPLVRERFKGRDVKLFLTCRLESGANPGAYRAENAARLVSKLGIQDNVVQLDCVPYSQLHHLYRACDVYVAPSYAESFAHPLVEAMASGLPVAASDIPVHREICGDAALYFPRFSPAQLAQEVAKIATSRDLAGRLSSAGLRRSRDFSWRRHVDQLIALAARLTTPAKSRKAA